MANKPNPYDAFDDDDIEGPSALDLPPPDPIPGDRGEPVTKAPKKKKKGMLIAVVAVIVFSILVVGFVGMFIYNKTNKHKKEREDVVKADPALQMKESTGPSLGAYQDSVAKTLEQLKAEKDAQDAAAAEAKRAQQPVTTPVAAPAAAPSLGTYNAHQQSYGQEGVDKDGLTPLQKAQKRRLDGEIMWSEKGSTGGPGQQKAAGQDMTRYYSQSDRDESARDRRNQDFQNRMESYRDSDGGSGVDSGSGFGGGSNGGSNSSIGGMLATESYAPGSARIRPDLKYLLIHGTTASCVLLPRIVTNYPGQTSCMINRDVYSADGSTVLIRSGSIANGERKVAMKQGVAKVFVVWGDVETPEGVSIKFDSMAADQLGAAGLDAWIDNHIPERFAGAVALSLIDDGLKILADQARSNDSVTFDSSTNNAQDMASIALENSINIPPTGYVQQATELTILVARDVDMRHIYGVL